MRVKHLLWIVPLLVVVFVLVALFPIGRQAQGGSHPFPGVMLRLESSEVAGFIFTSENRSYQGLLVGFGASRLCRIGSGLEETCGSWSRDVFFGFRPFSPGSRPLALVYYRPSEESVGLLAYFLENGRAEDWLVNFYIGRSVDNPRLFEGYLIRNDSGECVPFQEFTVDMMDLSVARQREGCTDPRAAEPAVGRW